MYPLILPLSAPAYCWVPFDCPNIVCQAELSKPSREDFKISKRTRTRSLSEYIPICQSSLQCDFCTPNHLATRPVTKGRVSSPGKTLKSQWNLILAYLQHSKAMDKHANKKLFEWNVYFVPILIRLYIYHIIHKVCNSLKTPLTQP